MREPDLREFMNLAKALADENRVRTLLALRPGELCVCQITELFGLAPSTMSKHLSILFQAGLLECRKDGRWMYYALPRAGAAKPVRDALRWVHQSLADHPRTIDDAQRLQKILKMDPAELCKKQCGK